MRGRVLFYFISFYLPVVQVLHLFRAGLFNDGFLLLLSSLDLFLFLWNSVVGRLICVWIRTGLMWIIFYESLGSSCLQPGFDRLRETLWPKCGDQHARVNHGFLVSTRLGHRVRDSTGGEWAQVPQCAVVFGVVTPP